MPKRPTSRPGGHPTFVAAAAPPGGAPAPGQIAAATGVRSTGDVTADLERELALLTANAQQRQKILEAQQIEIQQAKLGADATDAQKGKVADLVKQVDAVAAAQAKAAAAQQAVNDAYAFGANTLTFGIEQAVTGGARLTDVLRGVEQSLANAAIQATLLGQGPLAGLFGTAGTPGSVGGAFGGLFSGAKGLFAGFFAEGGTIPSGSFGIAGERGPELIKAGDRPLQVYPSRPPTPLASGSGAPGGNAAAPVVNHFYVTTPDATSFARSQAQIAGMLTRAAQRGTRNL